MSEINPDGGKARQEGASYDDNPWPFGSVTALRWCDSWITQDLGMSGQISRVISQETAERIWRAHREIGVGIKLLKDVAASIHDGGDPTPVDSHNRHRRGYSLGIPSGPGERILGVDPKLAREVIEAHIDNARRELVLATDAALKETQE